MSTLEDIKKQRKTGIGPTSSLLYIKRVGRLDNSH